MIKFSKKGAHKMGRFIKLLPLAFAAFIITIYAPFVISAGASGKIYSGDAIVLPGSTEAMETYTVTLDVTERGINSAAIDIKWTQTIRPGYYDKYRYDMKFSCAGESVTKTVVPANTWSEISPEERSYTTDLTLTVPLNTVEAATVEISGIIYQYTSAGVFNASDSDTPGKMSLEIPAYSEALKTFTVTYDANGGTDAPESQTKTEGAALTLSAKEPVRSGYTFKGWSDTASAASAQYRAGDSYTEDSDKILYAVWSKTFFTITTDANGGHFKDGSSFKNLNYREGDKVYPENFDIPDREGYAFAGWFGTKASANPASDTGNSITIISNKTYYAVWRKADTGTVYITGSDIVSETEEAELFFDEEQKEKIITLIFDRVYYIGDSSFVGYPNLTNVILFGESSEISDKAFRNCPELETFIFFGNAIFNQTAFDGCSEKLRIFVDADKAYPSEAAGLNIIPYKFSGGVLEFNGSVTLNRYEFFDTLAIFCLEFDNISKLKFDKFSFEDIGLYYFPKEDGKPVRIEDNTLVEVEITVSITENEENKEITFNELIEGIEDESITDFTLSAIDKNHGAAKDTVFSIVKEAIARALKWVVGIMNKLLRIVGKK